MQNLEYILGIIEKNRGASKDALTGTVVKWFLGWYEKIGCSPREAYGLELKARAAYKKESEEAIKTVSNLRALLEEAFHGFGSKG